MKKYSKKYLLETPGDNYEEYDDLFPALINYQDVGTATLYENYGDHVEIMSTKSEMHSKYSIHCLEDLVEYINVNIKKTGCYPVNNVKEIIQCKGYEFPTAKDDARIVCKDGYKEIWLIDKLAIIIDNDLPF